MPVETDVGFTGTKAGMTPNQSAAFVRLMRSFYGVFHEGDCVGSDEQAARIVDKLGGYFIHVHPPSNNKYRANFIPKFSRYRIWEPKPYGERDLDIVIESDVMVATPKGFKEIRRGSGTWLTIRMARSELKPLAILYPDGTMTLERWPAMLPKVRGMTVQMVRDAKKLG